MLTTKGKIELLERMRELLADPDRVVLDPMHYAEVARDGHVVQADPVTAARSRETCRVCFCGAATLAAFELAYEDRFEANDEVRLLLAERATDLDVEIDDDVFASFGVGDTAILTAALKQGRAVEVVDSVLADLRAA